MMRLLVMLVICGHAFAVDKMLAAVPTAGSHSKEQPKNDTVLPLESHQQKQPQLTENSKNQINNHNSQLGGHVKHQKTSHGSHVQQIPQNVQHPTVLIQAPHSSQKPTVPHLQHVEQVALHAQHHIPQVLSHYVAQQEENKQHTHEVGKQEAPNKMRASRAVHHHHVPVKSSHHRQKHRPHRPHHHHHHHNKKRSKRATVPSHVQQLVQQVHQHVPHVISQNVQQHNQNQKNHADHMNLEPPRKCNYECTHLDLAVCATNGKCWTEFESLCQMSNWNCLNTQKAFRQVLDAECMDSAKPKCYPGDMLN